VTLVPIHSVEIRGVKGPPGELAKICSAVGCLKLTKDRHHLWPKSFLRGQPYEWVMTPWGQIVQNTTGLCVQHHGMVTGEIGGHKACVLVEGKTFMWAEKHANEWVVMGPLTPQPGEIEHDDVALHQELGEGQTCEACGYTKPVKREPAPMRPVSTWGVAVPADAELGAEVLDSWIDDFAVMLGFGQESSRLKRYHVLAVILAWASVHKPLLIKDIVESRR
jgi:hypothetical protein